MVEKTHQQMAGQQCDGTGQEHKEVSMRRLQHLTSRTELGGAGKSARTGHFSPCPDAARRGPGLDDRASLAGTARQGWPVGHGTTNVQTTLVLHLRLPARTTASPSPRAISPRCRGKARQPQNCCPARRWRREGCRQGGQRRYTQCACG
ncbi:unnamed protein product [Pleuronectes platessa]|uniref:Uncharacterized protein n=1 Tax=Pleuronectes platessa TaxID=8262 RepID=A0A9N7VW66_PLEPL|nr:unnamed protein product [Pleuronectes platessa]